MASDVENPGPSTFFRFGDLPRELRFQVYENAFPSRLLRFAKKTRPDCASTVFALPIPLGPPAIAQVCSEAWEYAQMKYRRLPYYEARLFVLSYDFPTAVSQPKLTWFNPSLDVMCVEFSRISVYSHIRIKNPKRTMYLDGNLEARESEDDIYSRVVGAVLPFSELAENVLVFPYHGPFSDLSFCPYADNKVFPRIRTVLLSMHQQDWNDDNWTPPPHSSTRLLDLDIPSESYQKHIAAEFGSLDPEFGHPRTKFLAQGAFLTLLWWRIKQKWDNQIKPKIIPRDQRIDDELERIYLHSQYTFELTKLDVVGMWLLASCYLRKDFKVSEIDQGVYVDYDKLDAMIAEVKNGGPFPQLKLVATINRAPACACPAARYCIS